MKGFKDRAFDSAVFACETGSEFGWGRCTVTLDPRDRYVADEAGVLRLSADRDPRLYVRSVVAGGPGPAVGTRGRLQAVKGTLVMGVAYAVRVAGPACPGVYAFGIEAPDGEARPITYRST